MIEDWKEIPGYEGFYEVSSLGRIKSVFRITVRSNNTVHSTKERFLKSVIANTGYLVVSLRKPGSIKTYQVHRLVGILFVANPQRLPHLHHKDFDRTNPKFDNLKWVTVSDNNKLSRLAGRTSTSFGGYVREKAIKVNGCEFSSLKSASEILGIHKTTISKAVNGRLKYGDFKFSFV